MELHDIGNDERVLDLCDDSEEVLSIVCLGEAYGCIGTFGDSETVFQQTVTGEHRVFFSPSSVANIHVKPSAIVFGKRSLFPKATPSPSRVLRDDEETSARGSSTCTAISGDSTKVFDRILVEACCGPDSVLCRDTVANRGCLKIPITEQIDFASHEAEVICNDNLRCSSHRLWFSCPCTGGSSWQNYNMTRGPETVEKILGHWEKSRMLWSIFEKVAIPAILRGASIFI